MSALPTRAPRSRTATQPARRPQARPRLRVVAEPRNHGRCTLLLTALAAAGIFGVVSLNALAAESAFTARALEREVETLAIRYEELTAEVAALESPERVRAVALTDLGMVEPELPGFLLAERPLPGDGSAQEATAVANGGVTDPLKPMLGAGG